MPGPAVGSNSFVGTAEEVTYGTPVAGSRFYEILNESLERRNNIIVSNGIRAGTRNLRRGSRRALSSRDGGGSISLEHATTGFGRWWKHTLGGTPSFVQQGATTAWLQTHTMGDLTGKSQTIVKSLRDASGNEIETFNFHGCKVLSAKWSISVDGLLQLEVGVDAEDVDTTTAMPAVSYGATKIFRFSQGRLKVAGAEVATVTSAEGTIANALKTDRYYLGSAGLKKEPVDNDFPTHTGSLNAEFNSPVDFYDRFAADSGAELVMEFLGDTIAGAHVETCRITVPEVRFTGTTPKIAGLDVIAQQVPWEGQFDGTNAGTKVELMSTDTAA